MGGHSYPQGKPRRFLTEPARPQFIRDRPNAYWYAVAAVCFGAFMGQLDASIVTLAFPTMQRQFGVTVGAVQWVGLAYLLMLVASLIAVGRYADMVGRKLMYTFGFVVFIIGSALCGFAPDLTLLIVFRVIEAAGAAMLQANSVAIVAGVMPKEKLGRGIGVQGAAQALGLALGPMVGGLLIGLGGWPLIFFVNVPVGIVATVMAWYLIPRTRKLAAHTAFDWLGLAIFAPIGVALMLALSLGNQLGWSSPFVISMWIIAVVGMVLFVRRESRTAHPMLDLTLMKVKAFWAGVVSGWLIYFVIFGVLFVVPYYLERTLQFSSTRTGLELLAMPLAIGIFSPLSGRFADRLGAQPLMIFGMSLSVISLLVMAFDHGNLLLLVQLFAVGAGLGMSTAPNNAATMGAAPAHSSGVASGVLNMSRGLGTAVGLALTGVVFAIFATTHPINPVLVAEGFKYAAIFLAGISFIAVIVSIIRGNGSLASDPTLLVE
ncbi:MFS transporter [Ferrimicrobium sp.]|uniref:MFS transporter n=1 Tax=Ferrimicrobium sp. TaxID=2926050 RepID=UPI0026350A7C|nr:MFS transporter [Ferrimicrobium sp.]